MKKIRLFSLMVSLLATAVSFTACSDDADADEPIVVEATSVTLKLGTVTDESIEFTLTPVNAVKAAWVCVEDTGREVTAEQVLGCTSADAEGVQTLVADFLSPETDYVIWAAVQGKNGELVLSEPLKATTAPDSNPNTTVEITPSAAKLMEVADPQPGEFCVTFTDADQNYEVVLDFQGGSDAAFLAPGYYSLDDGSLLSKTSITGNSSAGTLVVCDAEVDTDGKTYVIDMVAEGDNGMEFHMVYEGEIENMPEVVILETVYAQTYVDAEYGDAMLVLYDAEDPYSSSFFVQLNIIMVPGNPYLNNAYEGYSEEDAAAASVAEYLSLDYSYGAVDGDFESGITFLPGKSFVDCMTLMPDQDLNLIAFQLAASNGKIYCGEYMGPLYGGGGNVSTEPVEFPYRGVTSAAVTSHQGNAYCIQFESNNGPMEVYFFTDDFANTRVYNFDANGGDNATFNGAFLKMAIEWNEDDIYYVFESGRIGVVNNGGNTYTFQFENVIARAEDGRAVNLGPVNGTSYSTQFTVTIAGL